MCIYFFPFTQNGSLIKKTPSTPECEEVLAELRKKYYNPKESTSKLFETNIFNNNVSYYLFLYFTAIDLSPITKKDYCTCTNDRKSGFVSDLNITTSEECSPVFSLKI